MHQYLSFNFNLLNVYTDRKKLALFKKTTLGEKLALFKQELLSIYMNLILP